MALLISTISLLTPTSDDDTALYIDHPLLSLMNLNLTEPVEMAEPQADESALILSWGNGQLVVDFLRVIGVMHGLIACPGTQYYDIHNLSVIVSYPL